MTNHLPRFRVLKFAIIVALAVSSMPGISGQRHRAKLSSDLLAFEARRSTGQARVIVRGSRTEIQALAARHGVHVARWLDDSAVLLANSLKVSAIAADSASDVLSGDVPVATFMKVSNSSTAADQVWSGYSGLLLGLGRIPGLTGQGVTVAVIDSGISPHPALSQKVIANVSLVTGDPQVTDEYGHGTHIAGIIAGNKSSATGVTNLYSGGIAPGVKLVNIRVLGANGSGWTSDVIAGVEWAIANRAKYNIKLLNMSLGHPVTEPSATDPLCQAVMKATQAGILVVVSAGNAGKAADGSPILGGITSPGNSPYALTVGATNTKTTITRSDDIMATYSSRGPTRFDHAVKPDVVAPGNKIVSLEAAGSYLQSNYGSTFHTAGKSSNAYMHLNGTSMSAAMVTAGAALLVQANPKITPAQLKITLQTGSTFMRDGGLVGGGSGSVNFWSSRKSSANTGLLSTVVSTLVGGILSPSSGATFWDSGTMSNRLYARTGIRLLSLLELPLALLTPNYLKWGDLNLVGANNSLASEEPNQIIWGDVSTWTPNNQIIWGDTIYNPEGQQIIWGDSSISEDDQIIWGDSTHPDSGVE